MATRAAGERGPVLGSASTKPRCACFVPTAGCSGKIEYDEYVQWFKHEKGKYNETEKAFDAAHDHMWSEVRTRAELQNPSTFHMHGEPVLNACCVAGGARPLNVTGLKAPEIY